MTGSPPGRLRRHVDRRIFDGRQIADRQRAVRDDAEQRDRRHQQAGGDRPPDEGLGDVHGPLSDRLVLDRPGRLLRRPARHRPASPAPSPPPPRRRVRRAGLRGAPFGVARSAPSCPARAAAGLRSRSSRPALRPLPMTTISPMRCATVIGRCSTVRVGLDDEHELAVLADLHGLARNDRRVRERREPQAHARELARPQPEVLVGERGLQLDRVGRGVDEVVDERELAFDRLGDCRPAASRSRPCVVRRPMCLIAGRCAAGTENVTYTGWSCAIVTSSVLLAVHEVAGLDGVVARAPVDRRADDRVAQLDLGVLDDRLLHRELRLRALDRRAVGFDRRLQSRPPRRATGRPASFDTRPLLDQLRPDDPPPPADTPRWPCRASSCASAWLSSA